LRASGHAAEGDLLSPRPTLYPHCLKRDEGLTSKQSVPHSTISMPLYINMNASDELCLEIRDMSQRKLLNEIERSSIVIGLNCCIASMEE